ncbi:MAG: 50S ribosomal protein L29 [Candidatus Omnitrophica bacterium]|nr:50S ribosomal protein L29 [Candidatus Omnitrophota bacterium]
MKTSELRPLAVDELSIKVGALKKELFDLRMQQAAGKLDKPHRMREVRRDIARMKTLMGEATRKDAVSK